MRARVEGLLKSYEEADFLELPAAPNIRQTAGHQRARMEQTGEMIGRYKLLQQIGEGGCGIVYMAEQEQPVRRRLALKIIKLGMDTKSVVARFEAERQALALMDHPNIAKILDGGATETGRPYFVMELVRGVKITEYCDEKRLSTRERLDLFVQVCQAVQHAHQKGIIHRDLKPSNILVTINDGRPVPKVIDFGIAKATTGENLTDKTIFTAFEQFIGTPAYMSPEQAIMTSLDIDTRADIYALGVLLYELLTGATPFDATELLAVGLEEMRRTIREDEPKAPSTRLSSLSGGELKTAAQRRGLEAPKLVTELRGDLDWIVMKCIEKDRARRYETASSLASDIRRHMDNEPVLARAPSNVYRFQKMFWRNKGLFAAAAAVLFCLLAGLTVSTNLLLQMRAQRDQVIKQRDRADEQTRIAKAVEEFLQNDLLGQADAFPQAAAGFEPLSSLTVKEALRRASTKVAERFADQPLIEAEIRSTLGETFVRLGDGKSAVPEFERTLALYRRTLTPTNLLAIQTMARLADAYGSARDPRQRSLFDETLQAAKTNLGFDHPETLKLRIQEARYLRWAGHGDAAIQMHKEITRMQRAKLGPDHRDTIDGMHWLAVAYMGADRWTDEVQVREEILKLERAKFGADHPGTVWALGMLAQAYTHADRDGEAEELAEQALQIAKSQSGAAYRNYPQIGNIMQILGRTFLDRKKFLEAETIFREALTVPKAPGADGYSTAYLDMGLADALAHQSDQKKLREAEELAREAVRLFTEWRGASSRDTADALDTLASVHWSGGKKSEAESIYRQEFLIFQELKDEKEAARALTKLERVRKNVTPE